MEEKKKCDLKDGQIVIEEPENRIFNGSSKKVVVQRGGKKFEAIFYSVDEEVMELIEGLNENSKELVL